MVIKGKFCLSWIFFQIRQQKCVQWEIIYKKIVWLIPTSYEWQILLYLYLEISISVSNVKLIIQNVIISCRLKPLNKCCWCLISTQGFQKSWEPDICVGHSGYMLLFRIAILLTIVTRTLTNQTDAMFTWTMTSRKVTIRTGLSHPSLPFWVTTLTLQKAQLLMHEWSKSSKSKLTDD